MARPLAGADLSAPILLHRADKAPGSDNMSKFETMVSAGREAEQLTTAFYRFLELRGVPEDADAWVRTEIIGSQQRCTIALWSEEASREFQTYLSRFRPPPAQLVRRFGPSRFDDL